MKPLLSRLHSAIQQKPRVLSVNSRVLTGLVVAPATVLCALIVRWALRPILGDHAPFVFFSVAIIASALYSGFWAGMWAGIISAILTNIYFIPPMFHLKFDDHHIVGEMCLFLIEGAIISGLCDARVRTGQELAASRARHGSVLATALDCIVTMDHEGNILEFNPAAEQIFGIRRADAVGKELAGLIIPERFRDGHRRALASLVAGGRSQILGTLQEMIALKSDGTEFPVELVIQSVPTIGLPLFTGYLRDISERRLMEEQLNQAQKMESVGQLAGNVAHEFNNQLAVIIGFNTIAQEELPPGHAVQPHLEKVAYSANRSADIVRQLLAFARRQPMAPRVLDLNELLNHTTSLLRHLIGEHIELVVVPDPESRRVKVDPGQFEQVLMNLAVNARDAMPDGGRLSFVLHGTEVDAAQSRWLGNLPPGDYAELSVSDTGSGMSPQIQQKIFEPFYTTKPKGKGTGLGLSTCYGLIKQAHGHISVESAPGRGTTFRIFLPITAEAPSAAARVERAILPGGTETVLVAEDEPLVREIVIKTLRAQNYNVLCAANGMDALRVAEQSDAPIDLLVTDMVMPYMGGAELSLRLRDRMSGLRVLFMTGYTDDGMFEVAAGKPGVDFLQKPFAPAVLARKVREVLDMPLCPIEETAVVRIS